MGIPQVTDRIKEAPAHALRAMFAGIGQLLLAAERLRNQAENRNEAETRARQPAASTPLGSTPPGSTPSSSQPRRSLDQTGNVRILSPDDPAEELSPPPAATTTPVQPTAPADTATTAPDATALAAGPAEAPRIPEANEAGEAPGVPEADGVPALSPESAGTAENAAPATTVTDVPAAALPVPGYDALSLPSLRARLRNLDAGQLRVLVAYERDHAARADVLAMFERRIAKLASE